MSAGNRFVLYYGDTLNNISKLETILALLNHNNRVSIILKSSIVVKYLGAKYQFLNIIYSRTHTNIEDTIKKENIKKIFYVYNSRRNVQILRYSFCEHILILNKQSAKEQFFNNSLRAYDKIISTQKEILENLKDSIDIRHLKLIHTDTLKELSEF